MAVHIGFFSCRDFNFEEVKGTCLWCGRHLPRRHDWLDQKAVESLIDESAFANWYCKGLGHEANGFFCTLRCAGDFGYWFVTSGKFIIKGVVSHETKKR